MDIFEYAMRMEKDGEEYFRQLAGQTEVQGLKKILTMLADEEVKHYQALEKMSTEKPCLAETSLLNDAMGVFVQFRDSGERIDPDMEQVELYRKAQDIEQKSMEFYFAKAEEVSEEYQRQLFLRFAAEERKHYFILDNIIEFVSRPDSWLENAEFFHSEEY